MILLNTIFEKLLKIYFEECVFEKSSGKTLFETEYYTDRKGNSGMVCIVNSENGIEFVNVSGKTISGPFESVVPLYYQMPITSKCKQICHEAVDRLMTSRDELCNSSALPMVRRYLTKLCRIADSVADAYLVKSGKFRGILNLHGDVIVPVIYESIGYMSFISRFDCDSTSEIKLVDKTDLFICEKIVSDIRYTDVYDVNGRCIFMDLLALNVSEAVTTRTLKHIHDDGSVTNDEVTEIKKITVDYYVKDPYSESGCEEYTVDMLIGNESFSPSGRGPLAKVSLGADLVHTDRFTIREDLIPQMCSIISIVRGNGKFADDGQVYRYLWTLIEDDINNLDIAVLDMSVRAYNCLHRSGIDTVGKMLEYPDNKFPEIRNLGKKSSEEVLALKNEILSFFHLI